MDVKGQAMGYRQGSYKPKEGLFHHSWIGFIRNVNVKLRQEQVGSGALWIKPVERNRPMKLLRSSMVIVRRTLEWNTNTRAWVMQ